MKRCQSKVNDLRIADPKLIVLICLIFFYIFSVANASSVNKMTYHNLATVFGPTLIRPAEEKKSGDEQSLAHATMKLNALRMDIHSQVCNLLRGLF